MESMPLIAVQNEFSLSAAYINVKIKTMDDVQLVIHACNIVAPYLHSRIIEYLQDISIEEVKTGRSSSHLSVNTFLLGFAGRYMKNGTEIPDLHRAKEYELFSII